MHWAGKSLIELDSPSGGDRVAWADIAKAFSIVLLVVWSMYGTSLYIDQMLILARMPMFFFVSGLFAHRVITRSEPLAFFRDKIGNLVYLYVIWALFWYLSTEVVAYLWWGRPIEARILPMMWNPIVEMWFFYGLALAFGIAWICRRLPASLVLAVSLVVYVVVVARGDWLAIPFVEKVARLFPFFWLGLALRPMVWRLVDAHWRLWPAFMAAFLGLASWVMGSPWQQVAPLTFAVTATGIAALLGLAAHVSRFEWSWVVRLVGGSTLYIYATQHISIFYLERIFGMVGPVPFERIMIVPVVVAFGVVFGRWCARTPALRWLFSAPWAPYKPPARVAAPAAPARAQGVERREA